MRPLKFLITTLIILGFSTSAFSADRNVYITKEMKLLNTYLKNIEVELKNKEPQMDNLHILSQLFLDTAYQIKISKKNDVFHKKFNEVLNDVKALNKMTKDNNYEAALGQARSIQTNCIKCHAKPK